MADSGASSSEINPSKTRSRGRSDAKREYDKQRDASRVYLFHTFERWRAFKEKYNLETDADVAEFLLDNFTARNTLCNVETQTELSKTMTMWPLSTAREESPVQRSKSSICLPVTPSRHSMTLRSKRNTTPLSSRSDILEKRFATDASTEATLSASEGSEGFSSPVITSTPKSSRRRQVPSQQNRPSISLSLRSDLSLFEEETLTASSGESDDEKTIQPEGMLSPIDEVSRLDLAFDEPLIEDLFNVTINGHDEDEPEDEPEAGCSEGTAKGPTLSPEYISSVEVVTPHEAIEMEKCIVYTSTLMSLITSLHGNVCKRQDCGRLLAYTKTYVGTCLVVSWRCPSGHVGGRWAAQPSCNNIRAGNLTIASALLLSGNSYTKVGLMFNFCNLQYFSQTLFNQYQQLYIIPTINEFWEQHKQQLWDEKAGKDVILSGDGRNDSPGHSAQYCTYSLADMHDSSILQMNVVDVREAAGKSNNMERIGFERGLDKLLTSKMAVKEVVTDGHLEIAALMKREEKYKDVVHQNDVWHGGKNLAKKINAAAKAKCNSDLQLWAPSIRNHFWHCSKTCDNDIKKLKDKWVGILHHVVDEHEWVLEEGINGGKCAHDPLNEGERQKPWLEKDSPAHKALTKIVLDTRFLNTFGYYTNFRHTGFLESFHNHILMYAPKRHAYSYPVYRARNQLAALDYNHHKGRAHATTADGQPRYGRKFSKRTQRWCHVRVLVPKEYNYIPELLVKVFEKRISSERNVNTRIGLQSEDPRQIAPNIALIPPPSVKSLVEAHQTRF